MSFLVKNVLTKEEIDSILVETDVKNGIIENNQYYNNSIGFFNLPSTLNLLNRIESGITSLVGTNIKFANTFTRIYPKNSTLKFHIDRKDLDITLSICLKRDIPWELKISNIQVQEGYTEENDFQYKSSYIGYDLLPGDGVLAFGRMYPHWREPYDAQEGQTNIYTFFHWTRI